jgi:glycosyltransferase involved in cell wall biosynthesis
MGLRRPLLVIINDRLSNLVRKGEITPRYYNPGEVFDEVHIAMTNDDCPHDPAQSALAPTVGRAKLFLHNLPAGKALFWRTLGWRPWLLKRWTGAAVSLARIIRPALVRCYGNHLNAFAARQIKRELGIPYVVSLHINPDEDIRGRASTWGERLATQASLALERRSLEEADLVAPVYEPIIPYLRRMGVRNFRVLYNVLNGEHLRGKTDYRLHSPVRVLSVGRQFREKDPARLLEAIGRLPSVRLTLIGDGPWHGRLRQRAAELGIGERLEFRRAVPNGELCRSLADYDIFATHSEYAEISKAVLEAMLAGLPVVINERRGEPVPELASEAVRRVENTAAGYLAALRELTEDDAGREALGRRAFREAQKRYAPAQTEARYAEVYRYLLGGAAPAQACQAGAGEVSSDVVSR